MHEARGDYIGNAWVNPTEGDVLASVDPASQDDVVLSFRSDPGHVAAATAAAAAAAPAWAALTAAERVAALRRVASEFSRRVEPLARAIMAEMGKPLREARAEARSLSARIEAVVEQQLPRVRTWTAPGVAGECRYHALGVVGVIGPVSHPLHLLHAHAIPALALGNTVVLKPSERTPLAAQRYVEAFEAAGLPPVLQMVQGGADVGQALVADPRLGGLAFTGSCPVGREIRRALVDRPEVLLTLGMGGRNVAIVLDDADLEQALEGVLLGAFSTTGQRCTSTAHVVVHRAVADTFIARLAAGAAAIDYGDPTTDPFMGPLVSVAARDRVDALCAAGVAAGAEVVLEASAREGGAWRGASLHLIDQRHDSAYTREELFGPDLAITIVDSLDDALEVVRARSFGLSVAVFTSSRASLERVFRETSSGCVYWNRPTTGAAEALPFGGVGRSGNHRATGVDTVRNLSYPVQLQWRPIGELAGDEALRDALAASDPVAALEARHRIEEACAPYAIYPEFGPAGGVTIAITQLDLQIGERLAAALVDHLTTAGRPCTSPPAPARRGRRGRRRRSRTPSTRFARCTPRASSDASRSAPAYPRAARSRSPVRTRCALVSSRTPSSRTTRSRR